MKSTTMVRVLVIAVGLLTPLQPLFANTELDDLIRTALEQNPQLLAQHATVEASRERIPQAGSLEDPRLGVHASNIPLSDLGLGNTPMSGIDFTLAQKIPFPGKLRFKRNAEKAESSAADSYYHEMQNRLRFQVSQAYYDLYRIDKEIAVTQENLALLRSLANTAEARYTTGAAKGPDVFRAQTFESELDNNLLALKQERESAVILLNTLLNRTVATPVKFQYRFRMTTPPSKREWEDAVKERPLVRALGHQIDAADQRIRFAERDYWPDFDVSVSYRLREAAPGDPVNGSDFISGGVTLNLPFWAHWREARKVSENKAEKMAAEQNYQAIQNESTYEAMDVYRTIIRQYQQVGIFNSRLLPQSRATYETSLSGFKTGGIDFFSTIEALKDKHGIEISYYEMASAYQTSRARLDWILGLGREVTQ